MCPFLPDSSHYSATPKIEAGRATLNQEALDLFDLLADLEEMLHLKATSKGLHLTFHRDPNLPRYICTDEGKLRQVLINLLGNAIKFTDKGSVTLYIASKNDETRNREDEENTFHPSTPSSPLTFYFEIKDTGPGIALDEMDDLFSAFKQTQAGLNSGQGTGLGLPISQKYVRLMGGEIAVNSILGQGTTFTFDIQVYPLEHPLPQVAQLLPGRVIGLTPDQPTYRILVVEDNANNRLLISNLLEPLGFDVREAVNGWEALEIWRTWHPHLIWMDMRMPRMDGYEATRQIRIEEHSSPRILQPSAFTKIIALTATAFEEQRQAVLAAGCDDFMRKPFRAEELLEKMSQHLGVQYVYEESSRSTATLSTEQVNALALTSDCLSFMPAEWVKQLHHAAALGSDELVDELAQQIPDRYRELAMALNQMALVFRFDQILMLTQPLISEGD